MANEEHWTLLKKGVAAWNAWRTANPDIVPDLSEFVFTGDQLRGSFIWGRRKGDRDGSERLLLEGANLSGANMGSAQLVGADLTNADLSNANLAYAGLSRAILCGADLTGANLYDAKLIGANLTGAIATGANFGAAKLCAADLSNADLSRVNFWFSDLKEAKLSGVTYDAAHMLRHITGIKNAESATGSSELRALLRPDRGVRQSASFFGDTLAEDERDGQPKPKPEEFPRGKKENWNKKHLEILLQGATAWNLWREQDKETNPNLEGLDFALKLFGVEGVWGVPDYIDEIDEPTVFLEDFDFSGTNFKNCNLNGAVIRGGSLQGADFEDAKLDDAWIVECHVAEAMFYGTQLNRATVYVPSESKCAFAYARMTDVRLSGDFLTSDFTGATLTGAILYGKYIGTDFKGAKLERADLRGVDFSSSDFSTCNFSGAYLNDAVLKGCKLTNCNLTGANVAGVKFEPSELKGMCAGVGGISEMFGDPDFQSHLRAQSYVDTLEMKLRQRYYRADLPASWRRFFFTNRSSARRRFGPVPRQRTGPRQMLGRWLRSVVRNFAAVFGGFATASPMWGAIAGVIIGLVLMQGLPTGGLGESWFDTVMRFVNSPAAAAFAGPIIASAIVFGFLGSYLGHRIGLFLWGLFDYGRDWDRVVLLGAILIGIFGLLYSVASPEHITFKGHDGALGFWLYPWYVAALGFATLGISDMVTPVTGVGMLLVISNVLAGWTTLGLLISVVGDAFKQRG